MLGKSLVITTIISQSLSLHHHSYFLDISTVTGKMWFREYMQASKLFILSTNAQSPCHYCQFKHCTIPVEAPMLIV